MCDTQKRIDKARWWLLTKHPFYGSLAMSMGDVIDPTISTACTDGRVIRWNPEFVADLSDAELRFSLLHETLHAAHGHAWRLPLDATGNEAGDYAINATISVLADVSMPEGCLLDKQYDGMSEEEIYGKLSAEKPESDEGGGAGDDDADEDDGQQQQPGGGGGGGKQGKPKKQPKQKPSDGGDQQSQQQSQQPSKGKPQKPSNGSGQGDDGDGDPSQNGTGHGHGKDGNPCSHFAPPQNPDLDQAQRDIENAKLREDWEQRVIQAAQAAQAMGVGDIPGDMERLLERMRHQEVDWKREMADFVKDTLSTRNDWSRAARRHAWQPVIYPRRQTDSVGTVIFARDTSGSINDKICAEFTALITDCVSEMNCEGIVIDCDYSIQAEYRISDYEACPLTAKGGGGTRFSPVFDRAAELEAAGEQIAGIVYLTDMYASFPPEPDIPTLWLATTGVNAPFGRVVRVELNAS